MGGNLEAQLAKFYKTERYQNEVKKKLNNDIKQGKGKGFAAALLNAEEYISVLFAILYGKMEALGLAKYAYMDVDVTSETRSVGENSYIVANLSFHNKNALSPSLIPERYDGVILPRLLNAGYNAKKRVRGYWASRGRDVWSLQKRAGAHFIESAVDEFNAGMNGVAIANYIKQSAKPN